MAQRVCTYPLGNSLQCRAESNQPKVCLEGARLCRLLSTEGLVHADCGAELGFPAAHLSFSCTQQAGPVAQRGPHTEPTQHSTPPRLRNAQHQAQGVKQPSTTSRTGSEGHGDSHAARAPNHAHQHLFALHCSAPISHPRCIYTATPPSVCITQDHPDAQILLAPSDNTHPFSMPVSLVL